MLTNYMKKYPLAILTFLAIVVLSLYPFEEVQPLPDIPLADKWAHMVMYGGWCMVIWFEHVRQNAKTNLPQMVIWGMLFPTATGGLLECMQACLTATRNGEWIDFAANTIGVGLGNLTGWIAITPIVRNVLKYPKA